jgi:methyl-accepting chemotaxis protein/sigma-B regulation protein RsbU (phosphoserine phosphatase)
LLAKDGTLIVYNKSDMLNQNLIALAEKYYHPSVIEAAEAMLAGETGYKKMILHGKTCYAFYKPFKQAQVTGRAMTDLGWSAGIIYPEEDIFGSYNRLLYTVLIRTGPAVSALPPLHTPPVVTPPTTREISATHRRRSL